MKSCFHRVRAGMCSWHAKLQCVIVALPCINNREIMKKKQLITKGHFWQILKPYTKNLKSDRVLLYDIRSWRWDIGCTRHMCIQFVYSLSAIKTAQYYSMYLVGSDGEEMFTSELGVLYSRAFSFEDKNNFHNIWWVWILKHVCLKSYWKVLFY